MILSCKTSKKCENVVTSEGTQNYSQIVLKIFTNHKFPKINKRA